jgi:N-acetylmuramic acid 6-phosphate etherase
MPLPPDRGHLRTEQGHDSSHEFDALSSLEAARLMIADQQRAIASVLGAQNALATFIDETVIRMRSGGRLVYVGAGTSGRLGVLDASECPPTFQSSPEQVVGLIAGGDASLRRSSESKEDDPEGVAPEFDQLRLSAVDTVLGIAAGGTTPYVLGAIRLSKSQGAMTGLLTCVSREEPDGCDHLIVLDTGPEILTGSTRLKAGTATKIALNIISTVVFTKLGKVYGNLMVDLRATNDKLLDRAIRIICRLCPDLSRSAAADLLSRAGNDLKIATVMHRCGIDEEQARRRLLNADGVLRNVIG